jgi:tetratricopeptide (TPR) repeat protein
MEALAPGVDRGVVTLYEKINCHDLLPAIAEKWKPAESPEQKAEIEEAVEKFLELTSIVPASPYNLTPRTGGKLLEFEERDQDRPPFIEYYVGRQREAEIIDQSEARIVYLTGIGGQGKSAVAANYLSRHRKDGRYDYVIWRDCKEEAERFEAQIVSIVHGLLGRQVQRSELSQQPIDDLTSIFLQSAKDLKLLLVFDNVDHYIDLESGRLMGAAATFAERVVASSNACRVIFTCRPAVIASHQQALELRLRGIDLNATKELFRLRQVFAPDDQITKAQALTDGHAFWLDLIAAQLARNPDGATLEEFLEHVPSGGAGLPEATLRSIWESLKEREQIVLRGLAEAVRPISAIKLADCLSSHLRWNQVSKAIKYLRSLNLVVIKIQDGTSELLELHPLVRAFVRNNFKPAEQKSFIDSFIKAYLAFFGIHRKELDRRPRPETVDCWLEAAEVCVQSGRFDQAFEWLNDVTKHVQATGQLLDFIRIGDALVRAGEWKDETLPAHFDAVFAFLIESVADMGRQSQTMYLLERYKDTIPHKNARYINYCDVICFAYWSMGDYVTATKWGVEGVQLKSSSGVDTAFDASHHLALAQRDSGAVDEALKYFLRGEKLEKVLDPDDIGEEKGGAFYGNIGRCLHFSGQLDSTLVCYRKSAQIIEDEVAQNSVVNKGYIRQWVGEVMYSKGNLKLASACFSAALTNWELVAPPKAEMLHRRLTGREGYAGLTIVSPDRAERAFLSWLRNEIPADLAA